MMRRKQGEKVKAHFVKLEIKHGWSNKAMNIMMMAMNFVIVMNMMTALPFKVRKKKKTLSHI